MHRSVLSLLLLALFLLSCTQAPQPYRHSRTGFDTSGLRLRDSGTVLILPIEGPSRPLAQIISRSLADALAVRNIPSTSNNLKNPAYKVRGQVVFNNITERKDYLGKVYWTFLDRSNKVIHESAQDIFAQQFQWDYGDQKMIDTLVDEAADHFASYLQDASEGQAVELAERDKEVIFKITDINVARGDGQTALRKAMSLTLRQFGARVREKSDQDTFLLSADIDVQAPFEGQERIHIAWIVKDHKGNELGRAQQDNRLPVGQLDEPWGRLAYDISRAAMSGIAEVVDRHRLEKKFEASRPETGYTAAPGRRKNRAPAPY